MNIFGARICRGAGLLLLLIGLSSLLPALIRGSRPNTVIRLLAPAAPSGWTTYTPYVPPHDPPTFAETIQALGIITIQYQLPAFLEVVFGCLLVFFARWFGRLLARGLSTPVA